MIYILIAIIVLLSIAIVVLSVDFRRAKMSHEQKVGELNYVIVQLMSDGEAKLGQLKLSDELKEKLLAARETLDKDLMAMQYDFVTALSKNNLLG